MPDTLEALAALEHEQWAYWTKHLLDTLGSRYSLPADDPDIRRWREQIATPYAALTEDEKDSDRFWARKALATATDYPAAFLAEEYQVCLRKLRDPCLSSSWGYWYDGRRYLIEILVARFAVRGVVVPLDPPLQD